MSRADRKTLMISITESASRLANIVQYLDGPDCTDAEQRRQLLEECQALTSQMWHGKPAAPESRMIA